MTNILLVDDHLLFRKAIKALIEASFPDDMRILGEAENGEEALLFLKNNKVDLVILDIEMPLMNGFDCANRIVLDFPNTRIVMLTMHNSYSHIKKFLELGVHGYFHKNVDPKILMEGIRKISKGLEILQEEITRELIAGIRYSRHSKSPEAPSKTLRDFSQREMEILGLISKGLTTSEIAEKLFLSIHTVNAHRKRMISKIGASNTTELVSLLKNE